MKFTSLIGAVALAVVSIPASAAVFDISLTGLNTMTTSQAQIFSTAENFWESNILGYQDGLGLPTVTIDASAQDIDGPFGVLGRAGPRILTSQTATSGQNFVLARTGIMEFDTADLTRMESNGTLLDVIVHEMAHVLGFGTLWEHNNLYIGNSGEYTGAVALATYNAEFGQTGSFIPVELDGGKGTANAHWDEGWAGGASDLMTGFLNTPTTLSDTSIAAFEDLGYITSLTAVPLPAPFWLAACGYGIFMVIGRRSKKRTSGRLAA